MRSRTKWLGTKKKDANSGIGRWKEEIKKTPDDERRLEKERRARGRNYIKGEMKVKTTRDEVRTPSRRTMGKDKPFEGTESKATEDNMSRSKAQERTENCARSSLRSRG